MPKPNPDTTKYSEHILEYTFLTGKCSICNSPNVVIRIKSHRQYEDTRIISGHHLHDYCTKHSPVNIQAEIESWNRILMTPPGA